MRGIFVFTLAAFILLTAGPAQANKCENLTFTCSQSLGDGCVPCLKAIDAGCITMDVG